MGMTQTSMRDRALVLGADLRFEGCLILAGYFHPLCLQQSAVMMRG
jgi:hypothetical protein